MTAEPRIRVAAARIDIGAEIRRLEGGGRIGALVTFVGYCRDEGGRLKALELEHYPGMADRELGRLAAEAGTRFGLGGVTVVHRFGLIVPGEEIVFVGASAPHRGAAFEGAAFLMDYLKSEAPFWKREHLADGTLGGWVDAKASDSAAMDRWHRL
ncbi:molybdenum cofactor biosynthesis protein MoaE [Aureimonas endophytica]|uniref:Molybdopterin synthase catalytic subunit n=1 Tax=Aureimonas endophytica TaxID=2027858 RepID=A0A916ZBC0_9HYPH|nr:molybdenum cofactor biosynthesis protein MoaE [Aureimonas endophytica]GGD85787.1 molybdenum cofactor biosynthesis protein MoaE [Aureimonas endophytica]